MVVRWAVLLLYLIPTVLCDEGILFPSDRRFKVVDPEKVNGDEFGDPKRTGSHLFDANVDSNDKKRLALAIMVNNFRSPTSSYFRAHPRHINCIQSVMNTLQNDNKPLMIVSGYKTKTDTQGGTTPAELYARSGTAAQLSFRPGVTGDLKDIATAALKYCVPIFEGIQRDIGLIMMKDRVHIHMSGEEEDRMLGVDGFPMSATQFRDWALDAIDAGMDPVQDPDCSKFTGLNNGGIHPKGVATPEEAVGVVDKPINRSTVEDFKTLRQYQGRNVVFTNPENGHAWCGIRGNPCIDCREIPAGNRIPKRCANRLMSSRMFNFLRVLQKMTRVNIPNNKLKVIKAFDEQYDGNNEYDETSLHVEGRQLVLALVPQNTEDNLKTVTKFAQCIGVDFIKHNGDHVILAVKKMKGEIPHKVDFQGTELLAVEPPFEKKDDYKLPDLFDESDEYDYPLFDSSSQLDDMVGEDTPLSLFVSKDSEFRYLRLHPLIPKCYSLLLYQHNKFNKEGDAETGLDVVRGYISTREEALTIDSFDQRYNTFTLGMAMEISYTDNPKNLSLHFLAQTAIDKCGPLFSEKHQEIGIGLYAEKIFVDIRDEFDVWTDDETLIPMEYGNINAYKAELHNRYEAAVDFRIVDPDDLEEAKKSANVPYMQSPSYRHKVPPHVLRRRRAAPHPDDCIPQRDTPFCKNTQKHRDEHIENIWKEISRKWHYHDEKEVREAFENCLGMCGTCMDGAVYEEKLEHCDNFLHWVPFRLMNENEITNFFPRDNAMLRKYACQEHCIEDAELFHLVVSALEAVYRPDPKMSVENELYPNAENPNPGMKVLHQLYAIHASGVVKVWVEDDTDISSLKEALQVVMLYNKNVTGVEVYVSSPGSKDAVDAALQNMKMEWATTGWPAVTREIIAPFVIYDMPKLVEKRDIDTSIREDLINRHWNRERRWVNQEL